MALAEGDEEESWWEDGTSSPEEVSSTSTQDSELGERNRLGTMIFLLALTLNTVWWYVFQKLTSTQSVIDYVPSGSIRGSDPIAAFFYLHDYCLLAGSYRVLPCKEIPNHREGMVGEGGQPRARLTAM